MKPVPPWKKTAAIRFLANGNIESAGGNFRPGYLTDLYHDSRRRGRRLWYTIRQRRIVAVVMITVSRGNVGFLHFSPTSSPHVDADLLRDLVDCATSDILGNPVPIVQTLVEPGCPEDIAMLTGAGLVRVTDLMHMNYPLRLTGVPQPDAKFSLDFKTVEDTGESVLVDLLRSTYMNSLDCPQITGVRDARDIVESHKYTGLYSPGSWYVAMKDNQPAGCVLLNRGAKGRTAELVYMGVAPGFRGMGIGLQMVLYAIHTSALAGHDTLHLSVDLANHYALDVYDDAGFVAGRKTQIFARY